MTLQCECGGALELTDQVNTDDLVTERYRCASCGETGTYRFDVDGDATSGCVTIA
jgi:hypothetical protein